MVEKKSCEENGDNYDSLKNENFSMWVLFDQTRFTIYRSRELELAQNKLTSIQAEVLFTLYKNGGAATQKEIADYTMRQHHSVSTLINRMAARGMVKKVKLPGESRTKIVMTEKALELYKKTPCHSIDMVFDSLTPEKKKIFEEVLLELRKNAREILGLDFIPPFLKEN